VDTCQCEALPPDVLARIVLEAIEALMDLDVLADVRKEVKQRKQLLAALPLVSSPVPTI